MDLLHDFRIVIVDLNHASLLPVTPTDIARLVDQSDCNALLSHVIDIDHQERGGAKKSIFSCGKKN